MLGWCLWVVDCSGTRLGLGVWALFVAVCWVSRGLGLWGKVGVV